MINHEEHPEFFGVDCDHEDYFKNEQYLGFFSTVLRVLRDLRGSFKIPKNRSLHLVWS